MATLAALTLVLSSVFSGAVMAEPGAAEADDAPRAVQQVAFPGDYICKNVVNNQLRFSFVPSCPAGQMLIQISASLPFDYCYNNATRIITDDQFGDVCSGFGNIYTVIDGESSFFICVNVYTRIMYHLNSVDGCTFGLLIGVIDLRGDIMKYACVEENLNDNLCDIIPGGGPQNEIRQLEPLIITPFIDNRFRLEFRGAQTNTMSAATVVNLTAAGIQAELQALPTIGVGNVIVTELDPGELWAYGAGGDPATATPLRVEFTGALGSQDITDPITLINVQSAAGAEENTVIDGAVAGSPGLNNVMPGGTVQIFNAGPATDPNNSATYGAEVTAGPQPVDAMGKFNIIDLLEGDYVVCATGTDAVNPSCEIVTINSNVVMLVNNVDLPGTITAEITDTVGANEVQFIRQCSFGCNVQGGTFAITVNGETTGNLDADATMAEVETALELLLGITDVVVTGEDFDLGFNPGNEMQIEFAGSLAGQDVPELTLTQNLVGQGFGLFYEKGTVTEGSGAVHTLTLDKRVSGGTFMLTYNNGVISSTTGPIAWDATVGQVATALNALASINSGGGSVTVSTTSTNPAFPPANTKITAAPFEVNFSGVMGEDTNVLIVDNDNLE